ncbi:MAG: hypothetical protein CR986_08220 [Ignavibacteriae bacterium]|nr:MAG: hypothetical protein CR986_08220 [Ignavibacteriota bacterium]
MKIFLKSFFMIITFSLIFEIFVSCDLTDPKDDTSVIYVLEKDHLLGGFGNVDIYHQTLIVNRTKDSLTINVESPTPEGLARESMRSPAYGKDAFIPTDFSKYFYIPNMANDYITNKPDTSTKISHFWNNLKLGANDGIYIPYSNNLGKGEELFIKEFGTNSFLGLDVVSEYKIEKNMIDTSLLDIQIKQTMINTTQEDMYMVEIFLNIPRELNTKPNDTKLYELVSDTVITNLNYYLDHDCGLGEGFGFFRSTGQSIDISNEFLKPQSSFEFTYRMKIKPLIEKFEIYPMYLIHLETKGKRIWPASKITYNKKVYEGKVDYLRVCGLSIPTYILFSIDKDNLRVVSPNEIEPTFKK